MYLGQYDQLLNVNCLVYVGLTKSELPLTRTSRFSPWEIERLAMVNLRLSRALPVRTMCRETENASIAGRSRLSPSTSGRQMSVPMAGAHAGSSHCDSTEEKVFGHGVLHVEIFKARGIKGDEIKGMGRADPYLKVKHGNAAKRETLTSLAHQDGGSNPVWNFEFCFPIRNGGTKAHNILEIEIYNENKRTSFFRADNSLGHLRLGGLAELITKHEDCTQSPRVYEPARCDWPMALSILAEVSGRVQKSENPDTSNLPITMQFATSSSSFWQTIVGTVLDPSFPW
ncbi:hypothetical protein R1flu_001857 [Riccia fluitans]|uniref:C2 domain-containing protein n=1 Tax=Riccia fluitans TaxID=41844 RepID=A0ABD1Y7G7_9MARC